MESTVSMVFQGEECSRDEGARDWPQPVCSSTRENEPSTSASQLSLQTCLWIYKHKLQRSWWQVSLLHCFFLVSSPPNEKCFSDPNSQLATWWWRCCCIPSFYEMCPYPRPSTSLSRCRSCLQSPLGLLFPTRSLWDVTVMLRATITCTFVSFSVFHIVQKLDLNKSETI